MAIDPLKIDNPVMTSSGVAGKYPIQFPAQGQVNGAELWLHSVVSAGVIAIVTSITFIAYHTSSESAALVDSSIRPLGILFAISVMYRWNSESEAAFYITVLLAVFALAFTAPSALHHSNAQTTRIASSLAAVAILWCAAEISVHYRSIDAELVRRDQDAAKARRERDETAFAFSAVVFMMALCLSLWAESRLIALPAVATFGLSIAYARAVKLAKHPLSFLWLLIPQYFAYPGTSSLTPGLISSAASSPNLRTIPIFIATLTTPLLTTGFANPQMQPVSAVWLLLTGLYAVASVLLVAASFSARPVHFDVNPIPFDVIISNLRNLEK